MYVILVFASICSEVLFNHSNFLKEMRGQNGPLALIFEIFGPETLFGKYIGKYHFLWYSSLLFVVLELGELEYPIFLFQRGT